MTRFVASAIVAALALFLAPTPALTQTQDLGRAIDEARSQIPTMAAEFGWTSVVPVINGSTLDTTRERVSLSRQAIAALVVGVPDYHFADAVRMIVAHEVWHFVDLNRGNARPGPGRAEERRVFECRADLMAGRYLAKTPAYPERATLTYSRADGIAQALWRAITPDHPRPVQRRMAAHFGALSVARDHSEVSADDRRAIDRALGHAEETPVELDPWSRHACERLTHFGEGALTSIAAESPRTERTEDGINFDIRYVNISSRPIEVSTIVSAVYFPPRVDGQPLGPARYWHFPRRFTVYPGIPHVERGILMDFREATTVFWTVSPYEERLPITARFVSGSALSPGQLLGTNLSAQDMRLALVMQRLANDSLNAFARHRQGGASRYGTSLAFASRIEIPGERNEPTRINLQNNGSSSVSRTLNRTESREEATAYVDALRATFERIWPRAPFIDLEPNDPFNEQPQSGARLPNFATAITRYARTEVRVRRFGNEGPYYVELEMTPNLLGVLD